MKKFFSLIAAVLFAGSMVAGDLFSVDFTKGKGSWTITNVLLPEGAEFLWAEAGNYGMKATAYYDNAAHASESWLISPLIDMSGVTKATLAINHAMNKGNNSTLAVIASTDGENWAALDLTAWPAGNNWNFIDASADLSAYVGKAAVQIAFVYASTEANCPTWEIKSVAINDGGGVIPPAEEADVEFTPADFEGQGVEQQGGPVSVTKDGVTVSANKAFGHNLALRCYKNSSLSVVSTGEQIAKLEFQFYSTYTGGMGETIVVNAQEWNNPSLASQARIEKLKVYFGESGDVPPTPATDLDTITVAKALEIGEALDKGKATDIEYVIKGYSSVIKTAYDSGFKNESFWIVDEKGSKAASNADGAFLVFRGKPDTEKSVGIGALVYVTAKIQKYTDGVIESWSNCAVHVEEQGGEETVESINVTKALEIGNALADKAVSPEKYEITGYVSQIYSFFSKDFNNETVWISDDPENTTTENAFEIYRGRPNTAAEVGWGAKVKIVCQIKNYGGTIENDGTNLPFEVLEASPYVPDTLSIEEAVDIANALGEDAKTPKYHVIKGFIQDAPLPYNYKGSDNKWKNTTIKMSQFPNESEGPLAVYKANILKADTAKLVQNSYAYVLGYLTKHGGAQVAEGSNVEFVEAPKEDTIRVNVAEALEAGFALPIEGKSDKVYAVTGFVNIVDEPFADGVETFYMADDASSEAKNFLILNIAIEAEAPVGQKVEVVGRLQNPNGETVTIENGKVRLLWPEGIESIVLTEKAQKVVVDGVIYIVRDNKLFNLQGAQVR